ncbi:MAG: hypothetical protein OEY34_05075 [Cyclobacteriaceae bacterium]|nr:hypothetical protein [Cyclobacteriaceae bacterium]
MQKHLIVVLFILFSLQTFSQDREKTLNSLYTSYTNTIKTNPKEALGHLVLFDSIRPDHPTVLTKLAEGYSTLKNENNTLLYLSRLIEIDASYTLENNPVYEWIKTKQSFLALIERKKSLLKPISTSKVFMTLEDPSIHPEGIAYYNDQFFISSIRKGMVYEITNKNQLSPMIKKGSDSLVMAVTGLKVFPTKNELWIASIGTQEWMGYSKEFEGLAGVFAFDLKSGELSKAFITEEGQWFGDLEIAKNGQVFISDSSEPVIYTIEPQTDGFEQVDVLYDFSGYLYNLQGITLDQKQSKLFMSDYILGIYSIDLNTHDFVEIAHPTISSLKGIDGLYYYENSLIAIHNGLKPNKVSRYYLNADQTEIIREEIIDRGRIEFDEPTLGTFYNDSFIYIANSPWSHYIKGSFDQKNVTNPIILKFELSK